MAHARHATTLAEAVGLATTVQEIVAIDRFGAIR